jgi:arginyl-tRNA synthetase
MDQDPETVGMEAQPGGSADPGGPLAAGALSALVEAGLDAAVGALDRQTDFRRSPQGAADVSVIFKGRVDGAARKALGAVFEAWPAVESARLSRNRLTLRFTDATLDRVADGLAAHPRDPLQLAGTASGRRIVVDYLDPNANKALHVGHLRNIALGGALAALWRARGAEVVCQSVICDIGRNIAEALAGVSAAGGLAALNGSGPVDRLVGRLYGEIAGAIASTDGGAEADAPIARELTLHGDAADAMLAAWRAGDPETLVLWRETIARVLADQAATLARLGQRHDVLIRESEAVDPAPALADTLVYQGLARREDDGVVILETGRDDYPRCPLTRSDGFATEHLRALVLWLEAANSDAPAPNRVLHVMGEEWLTSTEIRLDALRALGAGAFFGRYRMLPHQLVRLDGSTMKSSAGNTLLIDDLLDALQDALPEPLATCDAAARARAVAAVALTPFLTAEAGVALEIDLAALTDPDRNPGFALAQLAFGVPAQAHVQVQVQADEARRFALLQGERLRRVLIQASERDDPVAPARFLARLAQARTDGDFGDGADAVLQPLVQAAMTACGLLPAVEAAPATASDAARAATGS